MIAHEGITVNKITRNKVLRKFQVRFIIYHRRKIVECFERHDGNIEYFEKMMRHYRLL